MSGGSASLYLIEILHQTTTPLLLCSALPVLYLIEILHQTTTQSHRGPPGLCCILSKFYIKPQLYEDCRWFTWVVSYRNSTSNHNLPANIAQGRWLYLIEILHQTTTPALFKVLSSGCILSKFYIKPQQQRSLGFSYLGCILSKFYIKPQQQRKPYWRQRSCILSKFYIKPQHRDVIRFWQDRCILSKFYIKPQQRPPPMEISASCILSKFYIKPQQIIRALIIQIVVSYRNSTSNHNNCLYNEIRSAVVSYRNSTSNHNSDTKPPFFRFVVSYRNSTSNHNFGGVRPFHPLLYLIEILHQTTTK